MSERNMPARVEVHGGNLSGTWDAVATGGPYKPVDPVYVPEATLARARQTTLAEVAELAEAKADEVVANDTGPIDELGYAHARADALRDHAALLRELAGQSGGTEQE